MSTKPLFGRKDAMMAIGFLALTAAATPLDERIAQRLQRSGAQDSKFLENASTGVEYIAAPGAYLIGGGLYTVGRLTGNKRGLPGCCSLWPASESPAACMLLSRKKEKRTRR